MPRGDGTGPRGNGPLVRGRIGCRKIGFGNGFGRGMQCGYGFASVLAPETLESHAERLEAQAAHLRNLAKQNSKA